MSDCIGEGCDHPSHNKTEKVMVPVLEGKKNTRLYRGEECEIVTFDRGPFRTRIYVRYKGNLVHVGNRKLVAVKDKK